MKARCLCPYGDGSPSSHCWCIDMTAAWFHGAAKKPLAVSVNWDGTVSLILSLLQLSTVSIILRRLVWMCVCVCACVCARVCASAAAEHTNQQEVLIYLCSVFSHNLRERARAKVKKGEQICQSLFAMLVWNESTLCYLKHTQIRDVSPCQAEKKHQLSAGVLFSLSLSSSLCFSSSLANWNCCFWRDKGGLPLDLNIQELRIDIVKPYLHVYQSHSKRLLLTKLIRWN